MVLRISEKRNITSLEHGIIILSSKIRSEVGKDTHGLLE